MRSLDLKEGIKKSLNKLNLHVDGEGEGRDQAKQNKQI